MICSVLCKTSISLVELWHGIEVANEIGIIAFHDDSQGETEREHDSLRVEFDTLSEAHLALILGGSPGVLDDFGQIGHSQGHLSKGGIAGVESAVVAGGLLRSGLDDGGAASATGSNSAGCEGTTFGGIVRDTHVPSTGEARFGVFAMVETHAGQVGLSRVSGRVV